MCVCVSVCARQFLHTIILTYIFSSASGGFEVCDLFLSESMCVYVCERMSVVCVCMVMCVCVRACVHLHG